MLKQLNSIPIILEVTYIEKLANSERVGIEKKVFKLFTDLGFKIIASSPIGLSISAMKSVIEATFQTKIEVMEFKDEAGPLGTETFPILTFSQSPVIPKTLLPYIKSIKFSPPVKPLA